MRNIDYKSFAIGVLLTSTVVFGIAASNPVFIQWDKKQSWQVVGIPQKEYHENLWKYRGVQHLSAQGENIVLQRPVDSKTVEQMEKDHLLVASCKAGDLYRVRGLINNGANVNNSDKYGDRPLHHAESVEIAKFLISNSAIINANNYNSETPLDTAIQRGNVPLAKYLRDALSEKGLNIRQNFKSESYTIQNLHSAVKTGAKLEIKINIASGLDINAKDKKGFTALHWAVYYARREAAAVLLSYVANVNSQNTHGKTPLDYCELNTPDVIEISELLKKNGGKTGDELKAEGK